MKYITTIEQKNGSGDVFTKEFETKKEALEEARYIWDRKTVLEQKRDIITVIESVNPDEDAENHLDGDIVRIYK